MTSPVNARPYFDSTNVQFGKDRHVQASAATAVTTQSKSRPQLRQRSPLGHDGNQHVDKSYATTHPPKRVSEKQTVQWELPEALAVPRAAPQGSRFTHHSNGVATRQNRHLPRLTLCKAAGAICMSALIATLSSCLALLAWRDPGLWPWKHSTLQREIKACHVEIHDGGCSVNHLAVARGGA